MKKVWLVVAILVIFTAVVVFGVVLESNQLTRLVVTIGATNIVGAPVHIGSASLDKTTYKLHIKGFKVYNPKGFADEILADIPEIYVEYGEGALAAHELHLKTLKLNLKTLTVIKDKSGKYNVDELRITKDVEQISMLIDTLILTADEVIYKDFTKGKKPLIREFKVGIKNKTYKNITTAEELGRKILSEILAKTTIRGVAVFGAAALAGIALVPPIGLPIAAAILFSGNATVKADFNKDYDTVYAASRDTLKKMGKITSEKKDKGIIKGSVKGTGVKIKLETHDERVHVIVSARKLIRPNTEISGGILYEISRKLKK